MTSAHPNPLAASATMSGMAWAAITAGHWGFMALGLILGATIGALALALAAAAKNGDRAMEFDNVDDAIAWLTDSEDNER